MAMSFAGPDHRERHGADTPAAPTAGNHPAGQEFPPLDMLCMLLSLRQMTHSLLTL